MKSAVPRSFRVQPEKRQNLARGKMGAPGVGSSFKSFWRHIQVESIQIEVIGSSGTPMWTTLIKPRPTTGTSQTAYAACLAATLFEHPPTNPLTRPTHPTHPPDPPTRPSPSHSRPALCTP